MSEPSTNIPEEVADAKVEETTSTSTSVAPDSSATPEHVELELDEDKLEAWDDVKSDYQVDPDAQDTPTGEGDGNVMDVGTAPDADQG